MSNYLTIDIGGTFIKYAYIDENYVLSHKAKVKTPLDSKEHFMQALKSIVDRHIHNISGISISMPGIVDRTKGYVYSSGALHFIEGAFMEELESLFHIPVSLCNDAKAATLAELECGHLKNKNNALVLVLGTGIGGGIILNGKLYEGSHFASGEVSILNGDINHNKEFGYTFFGMNGVYGLSEIAYQVSGKRLSGLEIFEELNNGNQDMLKILNVFCEKFAFHLFNIQAILDIDTILIGGGISEQPLLIELLREKVKEQFDNELSPLIIPHIEACRFKSDANLVGAYYNYKLIKGLS